jgi:hypothetical protein
MSWPNMASAPSTTCLVPTGPVTSIADGTALITQCVVITSFRSQMWSL